MKTKNFSKSQGALAHPKTASSAQGALEYLLIIGAAILVIAVVLVALTGVLGTGKENANTNSTDSAYTGLRDIIDLGKGQTRILLTLKPGENIFEFESIIGDRTVWALFGKLPNDTRIEFIAEQNCVNNIKDINATKNNTFYDQNTGGNTNDCVVPENAIVKIYSPTEQTLEITSDINQEPYIILTPDNEGKWLNKIIENPNGKFKLSPGKYIMPISNFSNSTEYENFIKSINFRGTLDGLNQQILIENNEISDSIDFIFGKIENATIKNLLIRRRTMLSSEEFFIADQCNEFENKIENVQVENYYNNGGNVNTINFSNNKICEN